MLTICDPFEQYLEQSEYIDWNDNSVLETAKRLCMPKSEAETIRGLYQFVRDEISHSWDVQDPRVTAKASEVLQEGVGICWAKANLLAALLRACGIPAGICYQRLTLGDTPESGYCIHALNAVYVSSLKQWRRVDARGNKEGVHAEFRLEGERLAFPVRPEYGEMDYKKVVAKPLPLTMEVLENSTDALYMCLHSLPDSMDEDTFKEVPHGQEAGGGDRWKSPF